MFSPSQAPISAAAKLQFETQLALWSALNNIALDSLTKLVELNMRIARESLEESTAAARQGLSMQNAPDVFSQIAEGAKLNLEKAGSYGCDLAAIGLDMRADMARLAQETVDEANGQMAKLLEGMTGNVPNGAGNAFEFMQSALNNASTGYEEWLKTARQATDALGANWMMGTSTCARQTDSQRKTKTASNANGARKHGT